MSEENPVAMRRGRGCGLVAIVLLVLASGLVIRCAVYLLGSGEISGKYDPGKGDAGEFRELPGEVVADLPVESHTCGYHALAALYRAWGRDPERSRLRFRLGVDLSI
ncbi:MAG: hypothetical protein O3A87_12025 [Verrucomicrobia bacterium]|nr:hypothetical protein [Verrucomicrobiota bacterium]MDA1007191.1 hypothetical protein [Verrucomicrobiota bacterium]